MAVAAAPAAAPGTRASHALAACAHIRLLQPVRNSFSIQETRAEYIAAAWPRCIEAGFDTLPAACHAATDLLMVREALEAADEHCVRSP